MVRYNDGEEMDLVRQIADLNKRVQILESEARLGSSAIDRGRLVVKQPDGTTVFQAGELAIGIPGSWGIASRRANGTIAMYIYSKEDGDGFWAMWDKAGNIIASEDGVSGQGLATPWIPIPNWALNSGTIPAGSETTTSATFVGIYNTMYRKQHPLVTIDVLVRSNDPATTGEVKLRNLTASEDIGNLLTVAGSQYARMIITGQINGIHKHHIELELQARRTAGTGTIGIRPMGSYGRQSP